MQAQTTKYTRAGQAPKGAGFIWWEEFSHKLRHGAEVWLVLVQRGSSARPLTRRAIGRLCPSGLSPRQVEKQLTKLRRLGLIADGVATRKQVAPAGRDARWVTVLDRHAVGEARFKEGSEKPYLVALPKKAQRAVLRSGSGRKNGVTRSGTVSPEALQASESLRNQGKRCHVVNSSTSSIGSEGLLEVSSPDGEDAPSGAPASLPKPQPAMLTIPSPRDWDVLPLGDKHAARHIFRLYNSWREATFRRAPPVRGDIARQKWFPKFLAGVKALRERGIPPGTWIAWVHANIWKPKKPSAPPVHLVFSEKLITERAAWFWATQDSLGLSGQTWVAPASRELSERWKRHNIQCRLWRASGKVSRPANLLSRADYDSLLRQAQAELESKRIEIHEMLGAAEWLW